MPGSFQRMLFSDMDAEDGFFDSLKEDYPDFATWFERKTAAEETALVHHDDEGIGAFVYLKEETEPISLVGATLPAAPRLKIGTLKVATRAQGERLGEGAIGLALWRWRYSGHSEVYVTVYEKHESLVGILRKFGFSRVGMKDNGESVYVKDRRRLDYDDAYLCFPFLDPGFESAICSLSRTPTTISCSPTRSSRTSSRRASGAPQQMESRRSISVHRYR